MDARLEAIELLCHYFEQAGVPMTSDAPAELEHLVDLLIDAARTTGTRPGTAGRKR